MLRGWTMAACAALSLMVTTWHAQAVEISISCGSVGQELELCRTGAEAWAAKTGNTVRVISTPNDTNERLALYLQILSAGAGDIDVYQIDVVWPGQLARHFIDLKPYAKGAEKAHFPAIIANNTVGGKLVAMPLYTDAGLLFYRKDLLEKYGLQPPATWQDLTKVAATVQEGERKAGNSRFWGFVFQGKAYEGLSCDALEWIDSFGGGAIVDEAGRITINNPKAAAALDLAATWIKHVSPEGVLAYGEEEARGVFQSGNAAFMRNWPYAWALGNGPDSPIKGKIGVMALPKGGPDGKNTGTLGGWQLAVSAYSPNKDAAADLVMYLTSPAEQKRRALIASYNPTVMALYDDPDILKSAPFFADLKRTLDNAIARPSRVTGPKYNRVSYSFWNAAHDVLAGEATGAESLKSLEGELATIKGEGWIETN